MTVNVEVFLNALPVELLQRHLRKRLGRKYRDESEKFVEFAARSLNYTVARMRARCRKEPVATDRQVAMAAMKQVVSGVTDREVAVAFGRTDHATVCWARKKVRNNEQLEEEKRQLVEKWWEFLECEMEE